MLSRRTFAFAALLLGTVLFAQPPEKSDWLVDSTSLPQFWGSNDHPVTVPAPDGKLVLRVEGKKTGRRYPDDGMVPAYFLVRNGRRLHPEIEPWSSPKALWSPKSDMLAITSTEGGAVGDWKVYVYTVEANAVVKHNVMRRVQLDLARHFPGGIHPKGAKFFSERDTERFAQDTSWVNVYALHWLVEPERLLVLAEVPASSSSGTNMGECRGYTVDPITGTIFESYTEKELRKKWDKYLWW